MISGFIVDNDHLDGHRRLLQYRLERRTDKFLSIVHRNNNANEQITMFHHLIQAGSSRMHAVMAGEVGLSGQRVNFSHSTQRKLRASIDITKEWLR